MKLNGKMLVWKQFNCFVVICFLINCFLQYISTIKASTLQVRLSTNNCLSSNNFKALPDDLVSLRLHYRSVGRSEHSNFPTLCQLSLPRSFGDEQKGDGVIVHVNHITLDGCETDRFPSKLWLTDKTGYFIFWCNLKNRSYFFRSLRHPVQLVLSVPNHFNGLVSFDIIFTVYHLATFDSCTSQHECENLRCKSSDQMICRRNFPFACVSKQIQCDGVDQCFMSNETTDEKSCTRVKPLWIWSDNTSIQTSTSQIVPTKSSVTEDKRFIQFGMWCLWSSWTVSCPEKKLFCNDSRLHQSRCV